jgi:DNA mismatch repair protein MutS2
LHPFRTGWNAGTEGEVPVSFGNALCDDRETVGVNRHTLRALEYETVRARLAEKAGSRPGREQALALAPETDPDRVRLAVGMSTEGAALLSALGSQGYHTLPDVSEILPMVAVPGLHLEARALLEAASFIEGASEIALRVAGFGGAPRLAALAASVKDLRPLAAEIHRAILPTGEVSDDASPRLREARRALARLRNSLESLMEGYLRSKDVERSLQERLVTTRNDRYVLLLKAEQRGAIPGVVHGSSSSGASVFVEPFAAVEINNDIVTASEDEREEVLRVLRSLTSDLGREAGSLRTAYEVLGELDFVQAKALLSREVGGVPPEMTEDRLDLRLARHPLLIPGLGAARVEPVPVNLALGPEAPVLVISGPNTGGKTVALKTAGLLALMAQSGLHIPAAPGSALPVFRTIAADIGDEQSIGESLSTFSAHLRTIVEMTASLETPALVLLDEVGGGTDPAEGGALGVSIVDHFKSRGAMLVATTHHGLLKAYAQSETGVQCASFGYDPETYAPTYALSLGTPGRSLAFEMAERLGLPDAVVADARTRVDRWEAQAEALMKSLEEQRQAILAEEEALGRERELFEREREASREEERKRDAERQKDIQRFKREIESAGERAKIQMADAVSSAVKKVERVEPPRRLARKASEARTDAVRAIQSAQEEVLRPLEIPKAEAGPLEIGDRVRVQSLGVVGEVLGFPDAHAVEIAIQGKRLQVERDGVVPLPKVAPSPKVAVPHPSARIVAPEINLLGLTVEEALPRVDKLLDDASLSDTRSVRVIHGFGSGRLKKAVASLLEGHPHVAGFRSGGDREGGGGVTVVELKD